jgi:hypothetical protein
MPNETNMLIFVGDEQSTLDEKANDLAERAAHEVSNWLLRARLLISGIRSFQ